MQTKDADIRRHVHEYLQGRGGYLIDELGISDARADVVWINDELHAFEIKSDSDSLFRLPIQIPFYGQFFDTVTLATGSRYLEHAKKIIPEWWGVSFCDGGTLTVIRPPAKNQNIDPQALVQLMWREEAVEWLRELGLLRGIASKPRREIWKRIADTQSVEAIKERVIRCFLSRNKWRSLVTL